MGKLWAILVNVLGIIFIISDVIVLIVCSNIWDFRTALIIFLGLLLEELVIEGPLYAISGLYRELHSVNDNLYKNLEEVNNNVISAKKEILNSKNEILNLITGTSEQTSEQITTRTQAIMQNQQNNDEFKLQYIGEKVFYAKDGKYYCPKCKKPANPDMFSCNYCNADFIRN